MNRKTSWIVVAAFVIAGAWYAFRPERLFINQTVNEGFPVEQARAAEPKAIYMGQFHDGAHKTMGKAVIYQQENGRRILRLSEFETSNGPDVHLYLVAAPDATDNAVVTKAGFVTLGALKGNKGDQNYEIPGGTDLDKYRSVTVWCRRFGVNFGTAPMTQQQ
jgi:hypothetical protein